MAFAVPAASDALVKKVWNDKNIHKKYDEKNLLQKALKRVKFNVFMFAFFVIYFFHCFSFFSFLFVFVYNCLYLFSSYLCYSVVYVEIECDPK